MTDTKSMKLLAVDWIDSKGVTNRWEFADDLDPLEPTRCTTVGFLVKKTRQYLTLVQTIGGDQILGRITIPVRAVLKQRSLR